MVRQGETMLEMWKRRGLVAEHTTLADIVSGNFSPGQTPSAASVVSVKHKKLGPDDYLHSVKKLVLASHLPEPEVDYQFHDERGWELDLAWPEQKIAMELHGGVFEGPRRGRHIRAEGFTEDRAKMNRAQLEGWIVLEVVCPKGVAEGLDQLKEAFTLRGLHE